MRHDGWDPWTPDELALVKMGNYRVEAINAYRARTGCSLFEAKKSYEREEIRTDADRYIDCTVDLLFAGRKGHGGGSCTRRVLNPMQLAEILRRAYERGREQGVKEGRFDLGVERSRRGV